MALRRLIQQNHNANFVGFSTGPTCAAGEERALPMDSRIQHLANTVGTLTRGHKLALARSSSCGDSSRPQRHLVAILKEDKETFGFEIQEEILPDPEVTKSSNSEVISKSPGVLLMADFALQTFVRKTFRFPHQNDCSLDACTCVCRVHEESPAHLSGLQIGDILSSVNGVSTSGFSHKQIVDLIKSSGNYLRLETLNGAAFLQKAELEARLQFLKQTLQQKRVELQSLLLREQRLLHGEVNDNDLLGMPELEECNLLGDCSMPGPLFPTKPRFSSESSSRSRLSSMTMDSEDSFSQSFASEDSATESLSRQSSMDDDCFFPRDGDSAAGRSSLRRNRSISLASSGSMSPLWEGSSCTSSFGTLTRKSRRSSVRKHLWKFIPGLHRAVEEEESRV